MERWFTLLNRVPSGKFNRVNWQDPIGRTLLTKKLINERLRHKIIIPTFQYSLAQTWLAWTQFYTFGLRNITATT